MTPRQILLVQDTFAAVRDDADQAARLFYQQLFAQQPSLRALFADDMREQRRRLMQMIGVAISHLDRVEALLPALHDLGRRHLAYGVRDDDYETVGAALLATLALALGPRFDGETCAAWRAAYDLLAGAMKAGAEDGMVRESAVA